MKFALVLLLLCQYGARGEARVLAAGETTPDLSEEVKALSGVVAELKGQLGNMETSVEEMKAELTAAKTQVEALQKETSELKSLTPRVTANESKAVALETQSADLQNRLSASEKQLLEFGARMDQLETQVANKTDVAFFAGLSDVGELGPFNTDVTLTFSHVLTNVGGGYRASTGFFTAPVKGVYYFQFTAASRSAGTSGIFVMKNNKIIMYNLEGKQHWGLNYITNSLFLELNAGDEISLRLPSQTTIYDDYNRHSSFSGALLSML